MAHEKRGVTSGTQLRFVSHDSVTEADSLRPESEVREYLSPPKVIALKSDPCEVSWNVELHPGTART